MTDQNSVWFRLGYALEAAKPSKVRPRDGSRLRNPFSKNGKPDETLLEALLTAGTGAVAGRVLFGGSKPGGFRLLRAAAAGATAAATRSLIRIVLDMEPEGGTLDPGREALEGAARGLLYGAVVEPRLPGSPLMRGMAFGAVEYVVAPWGGLDEVLGAASPRHTMPILGALLAVERSPSESFTDHLIFGVALGLLYGVGRARRGSREAV